MPRINSLEMMTLPLTSEYLSKRIIIGDYEADPTAYSEEYDVSNMGLYNFLGLNVNGLTYVQNNYVKYDKNTGILASSIPIGTNDDVSIICNKMTAMGSQLVALSLPIVLDGVKDFVGDYEADPTNYEEYYDLSSLPIYNFIGININSAFYCNTNNVTYDKIAKKITIKRISLDPLDNICLVYNQQK